MLLPDDSDFYQGTGNWGGAHPDFDGPGTPLAYDKVLLAKSTEAATQGAAARCR